MASRWSGQRPPTSPANGEAKLARRPSQVGGPAGFATPPTKPFGIPMPIGAPRRGQANPASVPAEERTPRPEPQDRTYWERPVPRAEQQSGEAIRLPESVQYLGRLADKMFTVGRIDAAVNILGGPIAELLSAAKSGHVPDPQEVDAAGR